MASPQLESLSNFNSANNSVMSEVINFDSGIFNVKLPLLNADNGNYSISLLGKARTITISGVFTGSSDSAIKTFRREIENIQNSASQVERDYTTSDGDTYVIMINSSTFTRDLQSPNIIKYTIELITSNNILEL